MRFCEANNCSTPVFGSCKVTGKGFCKRHQNLRQDYDKRTIIQRAMAKQKGLESKIRGLAVVEDEVKNGKELWFMARRYEMKGRCVECGAKTFKENDKKYKWSCAHLVPKALVPSVSLHCQNWLELCWQCHSEYDSTFDKAASMKCFSEAKRKFQQFKHLIPKEELRKINPYLL